MPHALGRAMAQAVNRRPLTTEARFRSQFKSMWDLWWTKWHWDRFFSELSVFPCRLLSTGAPLIVKLGKKNCSSIYHHHWGCTKSLKAAVRGPFITNEKKCTTRFNIKKFYDLPTHCTCVLNGSQNKQRLFSHAALINRLLKQRWSVYCAVRTVFMCFVWISEQTAIISLYNINWLICITETECVYCAVRAESLNTLQVYFGV
jgi:hypothetical protein